MGNFLFCPPLPASRRHSRHCPWTKSLSLETSKLQSQCCGVLSGFQSQLGNAVVLVAANRLVRGRLRVGRAAQCRLQAESVLHRCRRSVKQHGVGGGCGSCGGHQRRSGRQERYGRLKPGGGERGGGEGRVQGGREGPWVWDGGPYGRQWRTSRTADAGRRRGRWDDAAAVDWCRVKTESHRWQSDVRRHATPVHGQARQTAALRRAVLQTFNTEHHQLIGSQFLMSFNIFRLTLSERSTTKVFSMVCSVHRQALKACTFYAKNFVGSSEWTSQTAVRVLLFLYRAYLRASVVFTVKLVNESGSVKDMPPTISWSTAF